MLIANRNSSLRERKFRNGLFGCGNCQCQGYCQKGMGDASYYDPLVDSPPIDTSSASNQYLANASIMTPPFTPPFVPTSSTLPTSATTGGFNFGSFLNTTFNDATAILGKVLPSGNITYTNASGVLSAPVGSLQGNQLVSGVFNPISSMGSFLPILLLGGGLLLVVSLAGKK